MLIVPGHCHRHRLEAIEPEGLDTETISFLRTRGIPAELRLEGWIGPTLFTSELTDGTLKRNVGGEWVLGTIRETQGMSIALAEFVIRRGQVVLLDGHAERHVNRSVVTFVGAIEAFHSAFAARPIGNAGSVLAASERIDPDGFNMPGGYWSTWVEEFSGDGKAHESVPHRPR